MKNSPLYDKAIEIVQQIKNAGGDALFAGGAVRDMLLGKQINDIDIATSLTPQQIQKIFPNTVPVGIAFGVIIVILDKYHFEVATFRNDGAYIDGRHPTTINFSSRIEDANRRDFTINAMYFDPITNTLYDDVNGKKDLHDKVIRTVGNAKNRFQEDALRLMRACRFAAKLDFKIAPNTQTAMKQTAPNIANISPERIGEELIKILTSDHPNNGIQLLFDTKILQYILPEVCAMRGVEQPPEFHPEGDVWTHTLELLKLLQHLPNSKELALACLFHDIGKPKTQVFADRIRFNNHETVGAKITDRICKRLKFSTKTRECIVHLVQTHLYFIPVQKMKTSTLKKFIWQDKFELMMQLHWADCMASHKDLSCYNFCKDKLKEFGTEQKYFKPFLQGRDLINIGLKPGRHFTPILNKAQELQLEGLFKDKESAIKWLKQATDVY